MNELIRKLRLLLLTAFLAGITGIFVGSFLYLLDLVTRFRLDHLNLLYLLPLVALLTTYAYQRAGKRADLGNNLLIGSIHDGERVPLRMASLTFVFSILSHLVGASVGREGTGVQIGGTLGAKLSQSLNLDEAERRILTKAGISAGFGGIFGTPLGGAFFGLEMATVGKISYEAILPCFLASFIGMWSAAQFPIHHLAFGVIELPVLSWKVLLMVTLASVLFGLTGRLFAWSVSTLKGFYRRTIVNPYLRGILGAAPVMFLLVLGLDAYGGLSLGLIDRGFAGVSTLMDPVWKFLLTVLSLGAGFQGGEATPLFAIGSSLGGYLGIASGISPGLMAGLGLIGVFGSATNTPLTTIMLGIELFGTGGLPYYTITALLGYYAMGHNSIYAAQRIGTAKHDHLDHETGRSIRELQEERKEQDEHLA